MRVSASHEMWYLAPSAGGIGRADSLVAHASQGETLVVVIEIKFISDRFLQVGMYE